MADQQQQQHPVPSSLPRVTIQFCTQCKWMLRAAYYAQELLSTFSTSLGEVALQPSTGGTFIITIHHLNPNNTEQQQQQQTPEAKTLWNRKEDGGFPETKELKRRVRNVIEPGRDLGHVDRDHGKEKKQEEAQKDSTAAEQGSEGKETGETQQEKERCEDCAS